MVQQTSTSIGNICNELNEFQVVHALITQSLKGVDDTNHNPSECAEDTVKAAYSHNIITAVCQRFSLDKSSSPKRIFPKFVKEFINNVRKSQEWCASVSGTSRSSSDPEKQLHAPQLRSCNVRYASVLKSSKQEQKPVPKQLPLATSSVHDKVLQFEKQADLLRGPVTSRVPSIPYQSNPVSSDPPDEEEPVEEPAVDVQEDSEHIPSQPETPPPEAPDISSKPSGKSLKRVPSERFQKMRRKVQRLMSRKSDPESSPPPSSAIDERAYLDAIRIPGPGESGSPNHTAILRMPDHVLQRIFSMLDTRTLASVKCSCSDFNFIINHFDVRATDSRWTKDYKYLDDPCTQCRHVFVRGDMSMCRFHPKRYYSDLPYGRSYWMCCLQWSKSAPGCKTGLHDNHWHKLS